MEWQRLKAQYPKAYALMDEYSERDAVRDKYCGMDRRDLYDFFDEHGINCMVNNHPDGGGLNKWDWFIKVPAQNFRVLHVRYDSLTQQDLDYPENYDWFENRTACEDYVFEKAFGLLEERLTQA